MIDDAYGEVKEELLQTVIPVWTTLFVMTLIVVIILVKMFHLVAETICLHIL
jgi:hypothetical protein